MRKNALSRRFGSGEGGRQALSAGAIGHTDLATSGAIRWVRLPIYDNARYSYRGIITICIDDRTPIPRGWVRGSKKSSPHRGEGVTAYAVTDEGSSFPCPSRGMAKGVPPCGAGPFPSDGKETKGSPGETHIAVGNRFPPAPVRSPPVPRRIRGPILGGYRTLSGAGGTTTAPASAPLSVRN